MKMTQCAFHLRLIAEELIIPPYNDSRPDDPSTTITPAPFGSAYTLLGRWKDRLGFLTFFLDAAQVHLRPIVSLEEGPGGRMMIQ